MDKKIVVTGYGTVNPLGNNSQEFLQGLLGGRDGIVRETFYGNKKDIEKNFSVGRVNLTDKELNEMIKDRNIKRSLGRTGLMTMVATEEALTIANLKEYKSRKKLYSGYIWDWRKSK